MSQKILCRLCLNICSDCKSLYCARGQTNEIYDITLKYFHTMFLNVDQNTPDTVMCLECWHTISDFHTYQQSVFNAQRKLLHEKSFMEYQNSIQSTASTESAGCSISIKAEDEDSMSVPDLEFMEEFSYCNPNTLQTEDHSNNKTAYNTEYSETVGTIHNGLHKTNEEPSICNAYKPEESANVGTIHNVVHNATEDTSIRTTYNPEDSTNIGTIRNGLHNANEELSIRNVYNPEDFANLGKMKAGLHSGQYEVIDEPEAFSDQSNSVECLSVGDDSMHSHGKQQITPKVSRRPKSQSELDALISKWKENLECGQCGSMVPSFALLQCHFRQEHPTEQCYIMCCGRKIRTRAMTGEHARYHTDPSAFKCPKCDLRLSSTAGLYKHKRKCLSDHHTPLRIYGPKKPYSKTPLEKIDQFIAIYKPHLECVICHENCQRFTELKIHFQNNHPDEDFYVMCCEREFFKRSVFKEHVWLHMDPNAFKCNICGRHHTTYKGFQVHMATIHAITLELKNIEDVGAEIQRSLNSSLNDNIN